MHIGLFSRAGSSSSSPASRVRPATWRIQLAPCASSPASRVRLLAWRQFPRGSHPAARRTARPTRRRRLPRSPLGAGSGALGGSFASAPQRVGATTGESCGNRRAHPGCPPERSSQGARTRIRWSPPIDPARPRRPTPPIDPSTTGARTRDFVTKAGAKGAAVDHRSADPRLLRPFPSATPLRPSLYEKKERSRGLRGVADGKSVVEGEVSAAEDEAGAAAGNRYIESYVTSAGFACRFRRSRRIQAVRRSTRAGARARKARPRWEIAFFSRALICAVVRPAPPGASSAAGTKTGS